MNSHQNGAAVGNPTILIVEDHDAVRISLREWLRASFPGCRFLEAKSGEEAVASALRQLPDIVLMDIGLPNMNGIQATQHLKAGAPKVQVVMLTIHDDPDYRADAKQAGAIAYVPKRKMHTDLIPLLAPLLSEPVTTGSDGAAIG